MFKQAIKAVRRIARATAVVAAAVGFFLANASFAASLPMGDPLTADPGAQSRESKASKAEFDKWDAKWREIQSAADKVDWMEHYRVCALKFRYRNYDDLFRCLDLFEAKVAKNKETVSRIKSDEARRAAPVLTGWLRTSAYAELGAPDLALKWAESAWSALPESYRATKQSFFLGGQAYTEFTGVLQMLGGTGMWTDDETLKGRNNPAGLDLGAETITMSLAAQRSLLYQRTGQPEKAKMALNDLRRWENLSANDSVIGLFPTSSPYKVQARLLSIGPLFAMGEFAQVIKTYDESAADAQRRRQRQQIQDVLGALSLPNLLFNALENLARPASAADARLFAIAIEDTSNAMVYAQSLARTGKTAEARAMLDTLLALREIRAMGNLYWAALYERSSIALKDGKREEAIRFLEQSVEAIEKVRSTIAVEAAKIGFAGDKQAVYAALVGALAEKGDWNEAFLVVERAKARSLVDLLAQRRDLAPPAAVGDKVRELFARAAAVEAGTGLAASESAVRGGMLVVESRAELSTLAPEASSLLAVQKVSIADIAARMPVGESLINYYGRGDDLYALVLIGTTVKGFKLAANGLDTEVRAFRQAIEQRDPAAAERGRALYDRLIRPLTNELTGNKLTISPHGVLHYLPFGALADGDQYLLDRFKLRLTPSAGTLTYIKTDQPTKVGKLLALGNPDLGNPRYDLPNAQVEAVNVAALFPASRALVRTEASKTAIRELGNGFSMLHFATHGKFNADAPLSSGLYLAKGDEPDGVLTVSDLYTLQFDTDLVTLSACETGLGKVANGDDVIGLTRGFLYAGARSIVASLWEVDDAATEQLMMSFYRNLQNHDKREALRLAQIQTRVNYPHPMFWAAFQIIGRAD